MRKLSAGDGSNCVLTVFASGSVTIRYKFWDNLFIFSMCHTDYNTFGFAKPLLFGSFTMHR